MSKHASPQELIDELRSQQSGPQAEIDRITALHAKQLEDDQQTIERASRELALAMQRVEATRTHIARITQRDQAAVDSLQPRIDTLHQAMLENTQLEQLRTKGLAALKRRENEMGSASWHVEMPRHPESMFLSISVMVAIDQSYKAYSSLRGNDGQHRPLVGLADTPEAALADLVEKLQSYVDGRILGIEYSLRPLVTSS